MRALRARWKIPTSPVLLRLQSQVSRSLHSDRLPSIVMHPVEERCRLHLAVCLHRLTWYGTRGSRKIGRVPYRCARATFADVLQSNTTTTTTTTTSCTFAFFCSSIRYRPRRRLCHSRMSGVAQPHDNAIASANGSGSSSPRTLPDLERPPQSGEHSTHSGGLDARNPQPEYHDDEDAGMMADGDHEFPPRPTASARPRPVPQGLRSASQIFRRRRPEEIRYMAKAERIKTRDELWKRGIVVVALILSWCECHCRSYNSLHLLTAPTLAGSLLLHADFRLQQMDVSWRLRKDCLLYD